MLGQIGQGLIDLAVGLGNWARNTWDRFTGSTSNYDYNQGHNYGTGMTPEKYRAAMAAVAEYERKNANEVDDWKDAKGNYDWLIRELDAIYFDDERSFDVYKSDSNFTVYVREDNQGSDHDHLSIKVVGRGDDPEKLLGGKGNDNGIGGHGNDLIRGEGGRDTFDGGNGNDKLYGGSGNDWLYGGRGNDKFWGGTGADRMHGNDGEDQFFHINTGDVIKTGEGRTQEDELYFDRGAKKVVVHNLSENDVIRMGDLDDIRFSLKKAYDVEVWPVQNIRGPKYFLDDGAAFTARNVKTGTEATFYTDERVVESMFPTKEYAEKFAEQPWRMADWGEPFDIIWS